MLFGVATVFEWSLYSSSILLEDVSKAGNMKGVDGSRSILVRHCFTTFDQLSDPFLAYSQSDYSLTTILGRPPQMIPRFFMLLENVKHLLSLDMRPLLMYVCQVLCGTLWSNKLFDIIALYQKALARNAPSED